MSAVADADPRQAVVQALRAAIVRGEFAPRQRLVEADLCEMFGTTRFVARAALQELAAHGLVEFERNKGARVRVISLAEAVEITEIRRLLEGHEAARAAKRITAPQAAALRRMVTDMRLAVERSELLRYSELNARLHAAIRDISAHETSARLLRQLRDQTVRHQFTLSLVPGRPAVSLPQHEQIVAAVTARDPARAEQAMHQHLQSVVDAFKALSVGPPPPVSAGGPVAPVVAVLGLGEAGAAIAADLHAAGAVVRGFDPRVTARAGVIGCADDADACRGAAVVLSLTCAHEAEAALMAALPGISAAAIYADLNTSSAQLKAHLAGLADRAGVGFADVALMSPVPGNGLRTPMLACGPGAEQFARLVGALGASVDVLPGPPGSAAARKLVRSVFYKGLAAAVIESLRAARAAGCEAWLRENIQQELTGASAATLDRLERGSVQHARRRADEMAAATEFLADLAVPPRIASASAQWLLQLLAEQSPSIEPAAGADRS